MSTKPAITHNVHYYYYYYYYYYYEYEYAERILVSP